MNNHDDRKDIGYMYGDNTAGNTPGNSDLSDMSSEEEEQDRDDEDDHDGKPFHYVIRRCTGIEMQEGEDFDDDDECEPAGKRLVWCGCMLYNRGVSYTGNKRRYKVITMSPVRCYSESK
uniref:LO1a n=1 Tax=Barramundi adomavirus TaxID=2609870 RepID=A0A6F9EYK0_9VIRU|nr:TPA_asm: LO1a [Barramundi adomavirus]